MRLASKTASIPASAITIRTYAELTEFAAQYAAGRFNLLAIVGTAGLAKTQTMQAAFAKAKDKDKPLLVKHSTAFQFYKALYDHLDEPVVLDDADVLFADGKTRPLMKALCDTTPEKVLEWNSKSIDQEEYPRRFTTHSRVAILCNEWSTINVHMKAITDRGLFLHFAPSVYEVHQQVARGKWLRDDEVYQYITDHLHLIVLPSMRYYVKARELKQAGFANWRDYVLNMLNPDLDNRAVEVMSRLLTEAGTEKEKEAQFIKLTKLSRRSYYYYKKLILEARGEK